jgi:hypothetical protein
VFKSIFLLLFVSPLLYGQMDKGDTGIPFALIYPNVSFYVSINRDTIFAKTYISREKIKYFYTKSKSVYWATYYPNGKIKEFGLFKKYTKGFRYRSKKNIGVVKIGIWNYYDEYGQLVQVIDFGKKGSLGRDFPPKSVYAP